MKKMAKLENSIPISVQDENVSRKEAIARRPHKLCQKKYKKFSEHGHNLVDWIQAEREIAEWHQKRLQAKYRATHHP